MDPQVRYLIYEQAPGAVDDVQHQRNQVDEWPGHGTAIWSAEQCVGKCYQDDTEGYPTGTGIMTRDRRFVVVRMI